MCSGTPRRMNRSDNRSMTSIDLSRRDTRMARHSWVNSSMMLSMRNLRPSWVLSLDEIVGSDVIGALCSEPDARSVIHPQASALGLPGGDLQPLASPDPLDPLGV